MSKPKAIQNREQKTFHTSTNLKSLPKGDWAVRIDDEREFKNGTSTAYGVNLTCMPFEAFVSKCKAEAAEWDFDGAPYSFWGVMSATQKGKYYESGEIFRIKAQGTIEKRDFDDDNNPRKDKNGNPIMKEVPNFVVMDIADTDLA